MAPLLLKFQVRPKIRDFSLLRAPVCLRTIFGVETLVIRAWRARGSNARARYQRQKIGIPAKEMSASLYKLSILHSAVSFGRGDSGDGGLIRPFTKGGSSK